MGKQKRGSSSDEAGAPHSARSQKMGPFLLFRETPRKMGTRSHVSVPADVLRALAPFTLLFGASLFSSVKWDYKPLPSQPCRVCLWKSKGQSGRRASLALSRSDF